MSSIGELLLVSKQKCFEGFQIIYSHQSAILNCSMKFAAYLPSSASSEKRVPILYYLSGLTCTEKNFIEKGGAQRCASKYGLAIIALDTSPRGCNLPGEDDSYDFGSGAGFYVDATQEPWSKHYKMYSYVTKELPDLIAKHLPINIEKQGIFGHSMGGHGSLICALKNPGKYCSVSAFAPICAPMDCPWGKKAFSGYLGTDKETWKEWDASELAAKYDGPTLEIYAHTGLDDDFYKAGQLLPEKLKDKAENNSKLKVKMEMAPGYDHSYYFVSTFMEDHIQHHLKYLK